MSLSIEIRDVHINVKRGTSRKTGQPYAICEQSGFVSLPSGETRMVILQHEEGDKPLPAGRYGPKPSAYWVGDFGALSISTRAKHWELLKSQVPPLAKAS